MSPPPIRANSISKIKIPRVGSLAKECTEIKMPDLTRNVPNKLSENVNIDKRIVQLLNIPFSPVAITEWRSAVYISHGIKDAFSTGSQNHHPPQPNS